MPHSLQALAGEVARLRRECDYFLGILGELERLSDHRTWLSDQQDDEIEGANRTYSWSAQENLERATGDLRNWQQAIEVAITQHDTTFGYQGF